MLSDQTVILSVILTLSVNLNVCYILKDWMLFLLIEFATEFPENSNLFLTPVYFFKLIDFYSFVDFYLKFFSIDRD